MAIFMEKKFSKMTMTSIIYEYMANSLSEKRQNNMMSKTTILSTNQTTKQTSEKFNFIKFKLSSLTTVMKE